MPMDNVTLENTQQSISSRDAKSVASVMVNGKWVNLSDTLEQANVKSDVDTVAKQVAAQQEVVSNAASTADSAVAYANDAIEKSRVNSQAIDDINSAVSDATSAAAVARSDGLRAWNAAQSNVNLIDLNYASASASISSARTEALAAADEAKKSASAAQADIVVVKSSVAAVQADVTATRSDVAVAKSAIADTNTGLASQAKSLSSYAAQASANGADIVTLKSQAGQFEQDMASTKGDVSQLKVSASSASVALSDAAGNISSLQATDKSYSAALSDTNSNVASVTATASELETKYADAAGDISQIKADAKGMTQTISDAQGDIAKLKTRADGFDAEFADTKGDISKLQTDATGTTQTLTNAKSDIAVLQSRADGFDTKYATAAGDINTLKTNASGFSQTLTNAQGDISTLKSTVTGVQNTLTDAQGNISTLQSDVSGLKKTTSDNAGNIATLQASAQTLTSQMSSAQGDISTLKQTASGISSQVTALSDKAMQNRGTVDSPDFNSLTQAGYYTITSPSNGKNYPIGSWGTLEVSGQVTDNNGQLNQKYVADNNGPIYTRQYNNLTKSWTAWFKVANQNDIETLNGKITANTTAIEQNKQSIALKADQTVVDKTNGTVQQLQSQLQVQAGQIASKVSNSDFDALNDTFNNMQIGGRNLLTNTDNDISVTSHTTDSWSAWAYIDTGFSFEHGKTYTFSVEATNSTDKIAEASIRVLEVSTNTEVGTYAFPADGERHSVTFAIPNDSHDYHLLLYAGHAGIVPGVDVTTTYHHRKLEIGNVATDWSPAPEDSQTYTQTQIKQTADSWNANLASVNDGLTQSYTTLHATVDGIQAQVYNSDGTSKITQLSTAVQSKVSQGDYNSQITQLKNDINLRVTKGDVISQINEEAGGNTLIQVSNGQGLLVLNAANTVITGKAWIPSAAIANLDASKLTFYGADNTYATMGASVVQYDDDKAKSTINLQYSGGIEIHSSDQQGSILTMHDNTIRLASKTWGDNSNPYQYSGFYAAPNYSLMNTYHKDGTTSGVAIDDNRIWIYGDSKDQQLGALQADVGWYSINGKTGLLTGNQITLKSGNTQATLTDNNINIENTNDTNSKNYDVGIHIKGWAEMTGWFTCMGLTQTSLLSTKTRIEPLDTAKALELINSADVATYQYKQEVAHGGTKRHASVIIDDVNDVARYQTPDEIISEDRQGRNDGDIVGYLMGAVQELTKKLKTLESKVG